MRKINFYKPSWSVKCAYSVKSVELTKKSKALRSAVGHSYGWYLNAMVRNEKDKIITRDK